MPRVRKQAPELDPSTTYVAWQSFAVEIDGYPIDVAKGTRLRGDHDTVRASWWYWLPDGAAPSELAARTREVYPEPEVHVQAYERAKPPPPLRDEDAMVAILPLSGALALSQEGIAPGEQTSPVSSRPTASIGMRSRPLRALEATHSARARRRHGDGRGDDRAKR